MWCMGYIWNQQKTITTKICWLCDKVFPFLYLQGFEQHIEDDAICTIQLNNLIIHMQIRTYARETLKTKTAILTLCTSNFNSDCVCSLFTFTCALRPYHIKSNRCVCWRESVLEWERLTVRQTVRREKYNTRNVSYLWGLLWVRLSDSECSKNISE